LVTVRVWVPLQLPADAMHAPHAPKVVLPQLVIGGTLHICIWVELCMPQLPPLQVKVVTVRLWVPPQVMPV